MTRWEYTAIRVDLWGPLGTQGGPKDELRRLGEEGWEAFAVTPPTPPPGDGPDPDESSYEILMKRPRPAS